MSLTRELQRRNVFRVGAAYVVTAWLVIQVVETILPAFGFGDAAIRNVTIAFAIGLLPALVLAWVFEWTPEGLRKESDTDPAAPRNLTSIKRLDRMIIVVLVVALGYFAFDKFVLSPQREATIIEQALQAGAEQAAEEFGQRPDIPEQSIAVLPFVNMSTDPEQEFFSDGLTEELLNLLAGVDELKVAARTSSFYYKDKLSEIPFMEIGRQLGVAYLLEGSVRRGGDKIRITAQLIKADDGFHLWSETWDRTLDDVFAIQDEISAAVVDSLKVTLLGEGPHAAVIDTESWELTLRGRFLFNRRAEEDLERALELFEQAVEIDPGNATAWIGMTPLYLWLFDPPRIEDSAMAVDRALELEPDNPEALARKARVLGWQDAPRPEQREAWRRAFDAGRNNTLVLSMFAGMERFAGNLDEAIEAQRGAVSLDPLNPVNVGNLATYLLEAGKIDEAEHWAHKVRELAPETNSGLGTLAVVSLFRGDLDDAREWLQLNEAVPAQVTENYLPSEPLLLNAMLAHSQGDRELATTLLVQYEEERGGEFPVGMAYLHTWRGETEKAWIMLERTREQYPDRAGIIELLNQPWLHPLHDDPRWQELIEHYKSLFDPGLMEMLEYGRNKLLD